jgi:hypothetical protein
MLLACATVHAKSYLNFSLIWNYQILYCFNFIYIADTARHLCNLTQYIHAIRWLLFWHMPCTVKACRLRTVRIQNNNREEWSEMCYFPKIYYHCSLPIMPLVIPTVCSLFSQGCVYNILYSQGFTVAAWTRQLTTLIHEICPIRTLSDYYQNQSFCPTVLQREKITLL